MLAKVITVLQIVGLTGCAIGGLCSAGYGIYLVADAISQSADKKDARDSTRRKIADDINAAAEAEEMPVAEAQ